MMMDRECDFDFKIADFGLASKCIEEGLTLRCGSPGYVAPEILKNRPYGFKVDLYSLGILLYILLSGRSPFNGKQPQEILYQNRECRIYFQEKYWKNTSREGMDLVLRMTDPDPKRRPSAYEALNHKWFQSTHIPPSALIELYYDASADIVYQSPEQ